MRRKRVTWGGSWALLGVAASCAVGALASPRVASADEGEFQLMLSPMVTAVRRYDAWRLGQGLAIGVRAGVRSVDWLSAELSVRMDQIRNMQRQLSPRTWHLFSLRRVGTTLGLVAHANHYKRRLCVGLGVGYRGDHRHNETFVGLDPAGRSVEKKHRIVAVLQAAFEWRWSDHGSAALWVSGDVPAGARGLDIAIGISGSLHVWK